MTGGFLDQTNIAVDAFETFNGKLYAGTWNELDTGGSNGGQILRTATPQTGGWEKVVDDGFTGPTNSEILSLKAFNGWLYAGTWSADTGVHGAEIYRSDTGDLNDWDVVYNSSVPGYSTPGAVMVMEVFDGFLYAGLMNWNTSGAELWRTSDGTTWMLVNDPRL